MSNGEVCCFYQLCCPPEEARLKMISEFQKVSGYDADGCEKIADFLVERFAFAPKSFQAVINDIVLISNQHHGV